MKRIIVLGSTGSIGVNALDAARRNPDKIKIVGLSTKGNVDLLNEQAEEFLPVKTTVWDESGMNGLLDLVRLDADMVVCGLVGSVGLEPVLEAIRSGKDIALANKEILVMAGELLMDEARKAGVNVIPVDSEHSALMQCLQGRNANEIEKLIITASGGPFYERENFSGISPECALRHPTWKMGKKVTIDSATLVNKGFEVIEASFLFGIPVDKIEVVIHPESIVHGMARLVDGNLLAFMHMPDMRIPIQYAMSWPERWNGYSGILDLAEVGTLTFKKYDAHRFPAVELAYGAARVGGTMPAVFGASDEICVSRFLSGDISFTDIVPAIETVMSRHKPVNNPNLDEILSADAWARSECLKCVSMNT